MIKYCLFCGAEFIPNKKLYKYCCPRCSMEARKEYNNKRSKIRYSKNRDSLMLYFKEYNKTHKDYFKNYYKNHKEHYKLKRCLAKE